MATLITTIGNKKFWNIVVNPDDSLTALRHQIVHCLPSDRVEHVSAKGLKTRVTKLVGETIKIIRELQKAGLK